MHYKNNDSGNFTVTDDALILEDDADNKDEVKLVDIQSIHLGELVVDGKSRIGQASLTNDVDGTTTNIISGTPSKQVRLGVTVWEMKVKSIDDTFIICMNPALEGDAESYRTFIIGLHARISACNTKVEYKAGSYFDVFVFAIIATVLGLISMGAFFMSNTFGFVVLNGMGGLLAIAAIGLLFFGVIKKRPYAYDPLHIPQDLLPKEVRN